MPNWCATYFVFEGNQKEISVLGDSLNKWINKKGIDNDFGNSWLGNIPFHLGRDYHDFDCRGWIDYMTVDENLLCVETSTAWVPMPDVFDLAIETLGLKGITYAFSAEEPGTDLYVIYDPHNQGSFEDENVKIEFENVSDEVFDKYPFMKTIDTPYCNKHYLIEVLKQHNINGIEELKNIFEELTNENQYLRIIEFEYIN